MYQFPVIFLLLSTTPTLIHCWRSVSHSHLTIDPYGKPCVNSTIPEGSKLVNCDRETKSLVCSSSGKCECARSKNNEPTMYDPEMKSCFLEPSINDDFRCGTDYQCQVSSYGLLSRYIFLKWNFLKNFFHFL